MKEEYKPKYAIKYIEQIMPDIYNLGALGFNKEQVMEMLSKEWDNYEEYIVGRAEEQID